MEDQFLTTLGTFMDQYPIPDRFTMMSDSEPHPLCLIAAEDLQIYLKTQTEWDHNFGLAHDKEGVIIGKMFGVLVVKTQKKEIGYLAAFSGKLAGGNHHSKFVPPIFDSLTENSFLNNGMAELKSINHKITDLRGQKWNENDEQINILIKLRRKHSSSLQMQLFNHYHFVNNSGKEKSLNEIFKDASYKNPPAGAGECAAPKLLQYAFQHGMKPLAMSEFWWGQSPKSDVWKHGHFYPCCREKCEPILAHMLSEIDE